MLIALLRRAQNPPQLCNGKASVNQLFAGNRIGLLVRVWVSLKGIGVGFAQVQKSPRSLVEKGVRVMMLLERRSIINISLCALCAFAKSFVALQLVF